MSTPFEQLRVHTPEWEFAMNWLHNGQCKLCTALRSDPDCAGRRGLFPGRLAASEPAKPRASIVI